MEALKELATTLVAGPRSVVKTRCFADGSIETTVYAGGWDGYRWQVHIHPSQDIVGTCARMHAKVIEKIEAGIPAPPI